MLYSIIEVAQAAASGEICIKALAYLVFIGVIIFVAVTLLKSLKALDS